MSVQKSRTTGITFGLRDCSATISDEVYRASLEPCHSNLITMAKSDIQMMLSISATVFVFFISDSPFFEGDNVLEKLAGIITLLQRPMHFQLSALINFLIFIYNY